MPNRNTRADMEADNRRDIGDLKEAIAQLNTSLAVNTEVMKGLKEVMDREFQRHGEERKSVENRVTVVEAKMDTIELKMAADTNVRERLKMVEDLSFKLDRKMTSAIGLSKGAIWALGLSLSIGAPSFGFVVAAVWKRVFG